MCLDELCDFRFRYLCNSMAGNIFQVKFARTLCLMKIKMPGQCLLFQAISKEGFHVLTAPLVFTRFLTHLKNFRPQRAYYGGGGKLVSNVALR